MTQSSLGFHSRRQLGEHFAKHGADFAPMTADEYVHAAQALRDSKLFARHVIESHRFIQASDPPAVLASGLSVDESRIIFQGCSTS